MLKTQQRVHDMMVALDLPLPNEDKPGLKKMNYHLYRSLVSEEAKEFDLALEMLSLIDSVNFDDDKNVGDCRKLVSEELILKIQEPKLCNYFIMDNRTFFHEVKLFWWAEVIDAICDIIVTVHNTSNAMGVDVEPFFDEVHRTNMNKAEGPLNELGKRLKPPGWKGPQIELMLRELIKCTLQDR